MFSKINAFLTMIVLLFCVNLSAAQQNKQVTFAGKVVDAQGNSLAAANVKLIEEDLGLTTSSTIIAKETETTSDKDGKFTFNVNTEADEYPYRYIVVNKDGFSMDYVDWYRNENKQFEFKLVQPKELSGLVVDENGSPIRDATVSILFFRIGTDSAQPRYLSSSVATKFFNTTTNAEGKFSFSYLPSDATVEFLVQKNGRATISTYNSLTSRGSNYNFTPGQAGIRIVQPPESKIQGIVVDKNTGKPVAGINLLLNGSSNTRVYGKESPVTSEADGTFVIEGLSAGSYNVSFPLPRDKSSDWVAEPVKVVLETGQIQKDIKVELSKGGLLEMQITEASTSKPVEGATASVYSQQYSQSFSAKSDSKGIARMRLLPGEYSSISAYQQDYSSSQYQGTVTINEGDTENIDLQLSSKPTVSGIIRDENGKPLQGVKLKVLPFSGIENIETNSEGKFNFSWNPGGLQSLMSGRPMEAILLCMYEQGNLAIAVPLDEGSQKLDIKLKPGITIKGKVTDSNGVGITKANINFMLRQDMWASTILPNNSIKPDTDGSFKIEAMPTECRYELTISANGYGSEKIDINTDNAVKNILEIKPVKLLQANLTVSGIVVDEQNNPLANVQVSCYSYNNNQPDGLRTKTDSQGRFTFTGVCRGIFDIRVSVNEPNRKLTATFITEGGASNVKIVAQNILSLSSRSTATTKRVPSMVSNGLPDLYDVGVESLWEANDKAVLVCFFDYQQRPSRNTVLQLAKQADNLKSKDIFVLLIQASTIDETTLKSWLKENNISYKIGVIRADEEQTKYTWGVNALPWLILTDKQHIVTAEGFTINEIAEKLKN
jgi:protocatechuate 3,4-dioxygenase beta subunit